MSTKPRLYNWVRAIRVISIISAYCSAFLIGLCLCWRIYLIFLQQQFQANNTLIAAILSSILFTIGLRKVGLRKFQQLFRYNHSFEFVLGYWCLTLLLIHLECQLLALAAANLSLALAIDLLLFIFIAAVMIFTWPSLEKIQKLLQ